MENNTGINILSMHDQAHEADGNIYFPAEIFTGFGAAKTSFVMNAVKEGKQADIVIISHINLLVAGWLIKKINPSAKIMLMAHGIEIWGELNTLKRRMLDCCDKILCVSNFTLETIAAKHGIKKNKLTVFNNCLDPFLNNRQTAAADNNLRKKYSFTADDTVLLTLTRLSAKDRYKGYDFVLEALVNLVAQNKNIKYLLAGGSTKEEKLFIEQLVKNNGLQNNVVLAGYVPEEELAILFSIADLYVMPSTKEGFGIVFIEAMYYNLPVIAGNTDGSADALLNGKLGLLIDPDNSKEIELAVNKIMNDTERYKPDHLLLMENFGYNAYKKKLEKILSN
ncbi:MAG: glycosyltransferase family 4 protein [Ferruginibacter sp.]|nr:glycosyltransferase family 4 protein [Ferruginibacter sp.]